MQRNTNRSLLTRREAADALAISVDTLARLIDRGVLQPVRIGRSVRVPLSEVQSFVNRQLPESRPETRAKAQS
jgi:excisionase family DNA binding protein